MSVPFIGPRGDVSGFLRRCQRIFHPASVVVGKRTSRFAIDGHRPAVLCYPEDIESISRCAAAATAADLTIVPVGAGGQLDIGCRPRRYDVAICTERMSRLVAYEPADMTITVEAGCTLARAQAILAERSQFLPFDPPRPEAVTIGGLIATDGSGPLRLKYGRVRDLLIGIRAVLPDGTIVKGGGRVVKNVAGYDLMKLLTGSYGTLAIIAEATFKVLPRPPAERCLMIKAHRIDEAVALGLRISRAAIDPAFVESFNSTAGIRIGLRSGAVLVGLHGSLAEIEAQQATVDAVAGHGCVEELRPPDADDLLRRVRDLPSREWTYGCRVSTLPSRLAGALARVEQAARGTSVETILIAHAGSGVGYVRCTANRASETEMGDFIAWIRDDVAITDQGSVFIDRVPRSLEEELGPWGRQSVISSPRSSLMQRIKDTFDPRGMMSPGRFTME